jgi:hypothetical protein
MKDSFNDLEKIAKEHKIHIVEEGKDKHSLEPFIFYQELNYPKKGSTKVGNIYLQFIGRAIYSPKTNELGIDWVGKPPELMIMGINGYLKERYKQEPKDLILNKKGGFEEYKIITS